MPVVRKKRCLIAAVALWGVLAMTFAPLLSHAFGLGTGYAGLAQICTAQGAKLLSLPADGSAPVNHDGHGTGFGHCPFCLSHASIAPPPQTLTGALARNEGPKSLPASSRVAARPPTAWAQARPRAPPVVT